VIRVGFVLNLKNDEWLGGINYYRNLLGAIYTNPGRTIEPVIFTGYNSDPRVLENFPAIPVIKNHIFDYPHPSYLFRRIIKRLLHRDIVLERLLKKNDISVLSHSGSLGRQSGIPTVGWIPDFQHKYLADFFTKKELAGRDRDFRIICAECTAVIFSSNNAKADAEKFYPEYTKKYHIVHFVPGGIDLSNMPSFDSLKGRYQISEPYFIVPNQFWIHKNHMVILEALSLLKKQGHPVMVIATGNTADYRQPDYFCTIREKIKDYDILENFKVAGIVPYKDLIQLMIHSTAVINPSLFEGWSTTVEEAKTLKLRIILSDIPVHREQNPAKGIFFPPCDSEQLADILKACISMGKTDYSEENLNKVSYELDDRRRLFAQEYEKIVLEALSTF